MNSQSCNVMLNDSFKKIHLHGNKSWDITMVSGMIFFKINIASMHGCLHNMHLHVGGNNRYE